MIERFILFLARIFHWDMASTDNSELQVPITPQPAPPLVSPPNAPPEPVLSPTQPSRVPTWASAVAHWEGANPLSNNPGNLKYSTLTASWGATKGNRAADGGYFCHFATSRLGFQALVNFLTLGAEYQLIISHPKPCTLRQFTIRFAGNPPEGYIQGICKIVGVPDSIDIGELLGRG